MLSTLYEEMEWDGWADGEVAFFVHLTYTSRWCRSSAVTLIEIDGERLCSDSDCSEDEEVSRDAESLQDEESPEDDY